MKVYITYDRYEHDEWYQVYYISTNKQDSYTHCKKVDLVDFISYGPDDCHSFQLQEVNMTKKQYEQLVKWNNDNESLDDSDSPYYQFMYDLYNNGTNITNELIQTDGCSDMYELVSYYGVNFKGKDEDFSDEDDDYYDYQEELYEDEDLFKKVLESYINSVY